PHLLNWLHQNDIAQKASFVYKNWLEAKGEIAVVREPILGWLKRYGATPEAQFVYKAWLDAKGEIAVVREPILGWLERYGATPEAKFVYGSWFNAKLDIADVRTTFLGWLKQHSSTAEASWFFYRRWLEETGDAEAVCAPIRDWLKVYQTSSGASHVYQSWLNASGEHEVVRDHLLAWIEVNSSLEDPTYVLCAWLEAGGSLGLIKSACEAWLTEHWRQEAAEYLTKPISMNRDLSLSLAVCIIAWAGTHPENASAISRLGRVSSRLESLPLNDSFRTLIGLSAEAVLAKLLDAAEVSEDVEASATFLITNLSGRHFARNLHWRVTLELFCACLRREKLLRHLGLYPPVPWALLLHDAIAARLLDPHADARAIRRAHDLIRLGMHHSEYSHLLTSGYLPPPPPE
ncbi:MAG: hypothetical protein ACK5QX_12420, partial [bacterium]